MDHNQATPAQTIVTPTAVEPVGAHLRALLWLGLPLIGSHVAQFALHVVDTVMLGWYGVLPLAAGVLGGSTFFVVFIFGAGFAKAVMPMVAAASAQGQQTQVRRVVRMGLWLSLMFGALIYPLFWYSRELLLFLGQSPEVAQAASSYLRIAGLGMAPALLVMVLKSYLAALGRTQVVLWVTVAAIPLNGLINWALIFGHWGAPELGIAGAAIATVMVQIGSLLALGIYAQNLAELRVYRIFDRFWRADWPGFWQVFRLGLPMGATGLAEGGLFHASALMMGWIGTLELAAHGIALEISAMTFMVHLGLSNAVTIRTAHFYGRQDYAGMRRGAMVGVGLSLMVVFVTVVVFLSLGAPLIGLFLREDVAQREEILRLGVILLACAALFQLGDSLQALALGLLAGVQDTKVPMIYAAFSYWVVGIPISYALAFGLGYGPVGLWFGLVIGLACAAICLMARFWRRLPR